MASRRLKHAEVALVRDHLRKKQDKTCPLCEKALNTTNAVLDHCHTTGAVRGALCRNCNGIEGKIKNLVRRAKAGIMEDQWLNNLILYLTYHNVNRTGLLYPTHKTEAEKRLARNAKARAARAKKKKEQT
jgi:hypothetical protein